LRGDAGVEDLDHVWMTDLRERPRLDHHPSGELLVVDEVRVEQLDDETRPQEPLLDEVDDAEATLAERALDDVVGALDLLAALVVVGAAHEPSLAARMAYGT